MLFIKEGSYVAGHEGFYQHRDIIDAGDNFRNALFISDNAPVEGAAPRNSTPLLVSSLPTGVASNSRFGIFTRERNRSISQRFSLLAQQHSAVSAAVLRRPVVPITIATSLRRFLYRG